MPTLLLPPPPILSVADIVFDAAKARWQVEQPTFGLPDLRWRAQKGLALYGDRLAVFTWAQALQLSLLAPPPDWLTTLPQRYRSPVGEGLQVRCFVADGQPRSSTAWARGGQQLGYADWLLVPEAEVEEASQFAASVLADPDVTAPPALVLDVERIESGWTAVAARPAWCTPKGYAAPRGVLEVLRRATRSRTELIEADLPWIVRQYLED